MLHDAEIDFYSKEGHDFCLCKSVLRELSPTLGDLTDATETAALEFRVCTPPLQATSSLIFCN